MLRYCLIVLLLGCLASCQPPVFTPKPAGYFRIDTPARHEYQLFDVPGYPYTFEYPVYARIVRDSAFFREKADNPYWLNIEIPPLGGTINLTYKSVPNRESFAKMVEDSYGLSYFHHEKADYMYQDAFKTQYGVSGVLYTVGGNAASRYQFTATDSVHHFMRGALYFEVTPNADSLKPACDFLVQDIQHMIQTLRFR